MYIESAPNRNSPPAILLRESYRQDGKVRKRTLAKLSSWPKQLVEHVKVLLRGGIAVPSQAELLTIERNLPHGHVAAVLGRARDCGAFAWFAGAGRLQPMLLASKRLGGAALVLYDLSSTWRTGRCCTLAAHGYRRDGKRDELQITFGLICTAQGCPIAVEVFRGSCADPATVAAPVSKIEKRFGIEQVAWVADRGMRTSARIEEVLKPQGMDQVSSLREPRSKVGRGSRCASARRSSAIGWPSVSR